MPKLIPDWRHAWRFHTVIAAAALGAVNWAAAHPDELGQVTRALAAALTPDQLAVVNRWGPVVLIVLRLVQQRIPARDAPPPPAAPANPPPPKVSP
jgi:hypothetical protein